MIRTGILHVPTMDEFTSGEVRRLLREQGAVVMLEEQRASSRNVIADILTRWCDEEELDLVLTIGGTLPAAGPSAQECVPEATLDVLDRLAPALPEAMRAEMGMDNALALLDRGVAGIRSRTLVINLPEGMAAGFFAAVGEVIPAYVAHLQGDANAPRPSAPELPDDSASASVEEAISTPRSGLNADEFAAFLARRNT